MIKIHNKSSKYNTLNNCKNCNKKLKGKFCHNCGFPKETKRINRQYISSEISDVFLFDKGIFYTVKELFIRPGVTVRNFIDGDRKRLVKPIFFLIICSLTYTIAQQFLSFEAGFIKFNVKDANEAPLMIKIFDWFSTNFGYANILMAIFIAFWIKVLFKKHNYNYYEIYILLCFIMGNSILIYTFLGIIEGITNFPILQIGIIISLIYNTWAIGQFFGRRNKINYLKGFLSYVLGILFCLILFFTIGMGLDGLLK